MFKHLFTEIGSILEEIFTKGETWFIVLIIGITGVVFVPLLGWSGVGRAIAYFFDLTWWLWVFLILFPLFYDTWLHYRQEDYIHHITWALLELRIPRNVEKSPQAMEQVLMSIHAFRNKANDFKEMYIEGEITKWFTFEMVSLGGEVHFYVRIYRGLINLVQAAFFSFYPDLDIVEVPDYVENLPVSVKSLYESGNDLWGSEMVLQEKEFYPTKTYSDFEMSTEEEKRFDPISSFIETLSKANKDEFVGVQILIAPTGYEDWKDRWDEEVENLRQQSKKTKKEIGVDETLATFTMRSPRQTEVLKAVEENLSKPAFETLIRFIYMSPKATFTDSYPRRGIVSAFNQYAALDMNSFVQNYSVSTRTKLWQKPFIFPKTRGEYRKARILFNYKHREVPPERFIGRVMNSFVLNWELSKRFRMNTKCLATLFHIPTTVVLTEPHLRHLETRKSGPPAGLAIFGGEEEIEKYK